MSDNSTVEAHVEGTRFYKRSNFRDALRIAVLTVIIFASLSVLTILIAIDSGARRAYKEARDVRKALRAVGTEYYGEASSIYDPHSSTGLTEGAAERIATLSQRDGDVTLYEWDAATNGPISFEYHTGLYRVVYIDTGYENGIQPGVEGDFKVYYSFELLKYEAE